MSTDSKAFGEVKLLRAKVKSMEKLLIELSLAVFASPQFKDVHQDRVNNALEDLQCAGEEAIERGKP